VLGPLVLKRDGQPVPLPTGHQRSLLALLLQGGGVPLSRDRLIDELWGERPPASAVSALHVHLSKLRALLDGLLVFDAAGYSLRTGEFELDVWRFDELVERARANQDHAAQHLNEALSLFRGEALCDVASEGSIAHWRRALEEKRLQAQLSLIDLQLQAGGAGELIAQLEALAAAHPFEERVWGQLMLALYRAGRQADALDAYQRARRLFSTELGLEPGEPLTRLQQRILDRDAELEVASAVKPDRESPRPHRSNIPRAPTRLVGRESELNTLLSLLADPDVQLITLTGPGGVGKTRLLLELARNAEEDYSDGALFVRLEQLMDPGLIAAEIASAVALRDETEGPGADGLVSYLRERELLLVIDNFEHLITGAPLIAELMTGAPHTRVIVSSRTPLRLRGEQVFEVEPLALPSDSDTDQASQSPAVQLFLQCALAVNRRLEIDARVTQSVAVICRALDGLPLAIELAASRSQAMSPAQIAEQLAEPLAIGEHALRDLPDRQQTLQATIRWSYDLLSEEARALLRSASVFLGGFTRAALEAVALHPVAAELNDLLDASLARRQPGGERYELLELVRAFAFEELNRSGEAVQMRARHRAYFAEQLVATGEAFDQGGSPGELATPWLSDHANLRAALNDAIDAGDEPSAVAIAIGSRPVWLAAMMRQESQELVERVLERFSIPGDKEVALLRAVAFLDYSPDAKAWHQRLAARAREIGDIDALVAATGNLFGQALNGRDPEEMRRIRPELLALITPETGPKGLGWIHYFLALDAYVDGRFEAAYEHATLSAENAAAVGHEFMLASAVATRVMAKSARDGVILQPELAEAVELMRRPGVQPMAAFALWFVARYAAGVAPDIAGPWLAHGDRIVIALDSKLWPESVLRDETLEVLGIADSTQLIEATAPLDHAAALAEALAWLEARDPGEKSPRQVAGQLMSAAS
jgi:predicted ATPase/DNA-binding SARP family transcriptional activator